MLAELAEDPENPIVTEAVQRAVASYAILLPPEVIRDVTLFTSETLKEHPAGISLVARLSPGLRVTVAMSEDPDSQGFQGFAFVTTMRAMMNVVRKRARERGEQRFLMPDISFLVLQSFLSYLRPDETTWTAPEDMVRAALDGFCEAILGALFLGLVLDLQSDTSSVADWGETGHTLSKALPRMQAALQEARSRMSRGDRTLLSDYEACDWDIERLSDRMLGDHVTTRCFLAFGSLGGALLVELSMVTQPN